MRGAATVVPSPEDAQVFAFGAHSVRVVIRKGEPWWVAADVCQVLKHTNSRMALQRLDADEKGVSRVYTQGGVQIVKVINEPGLYSLILRSNLKEAKAFKRWVTHEVLPQIRRTGGYQGPSDLTDDEIVHKALLLLDGKVKRLEKEKDDMVPVVKAHQILTNTQDTYSFREAAQLITKKVGVEIGQNRLFTKCIELGLLDKSRQPFQRYVDSDLVIRTVEHNPGLNKNHGTIRFTGKGVDWVIKRLLAETGQLPALQGALS